MKIEVTAEDIKEGVRGNGAFCPIAKCLKRQGLLNVFACSLYIKWIKDGMYCEIDPVPSNTIQFMHAFDYGLGVYPITLDVTPDCRPVQEHDFNLALPGN